MITQTTGHVLMTADTVGGVWNYAIELTRGLADYGIHVSLATMGGHLSPEQQEDVRSLRNLRVFESAFKLEWMQDPWKDVRLAGEWLLDLERRLRPDIIHLNNYAHGALAWTAPSIMVAHSCVFSWWRDVLGEDCGESWAEYKKCVTRGIRAARALVAPSREMLRSLYVHYGPVPAGKVIPNGRTSSLFSSAPKEPFILTAGRLWDKAKNVKVLEQIAADLPWPIRVAGEPQEPGMQAPVRFNGLQVLGRLSPQDLRVQYGKASIYVAPAKYEPFGLSILEAALSECPLVLGDIPSLRENWDDAAVFIHPDDPDQIRKVLQELIRSPWLRRGMAVRGRKRALQYSLPRMTAAYVEVYRSLLRKRTRTRRILKFAVPRGL